MKNIFLEKYIINSKILKCLYYILKSWSIWYNTWPLWKLEARGWKVRLMTFRPFKVFCNYSKPLIIFLLSFRVYLSLIIRNHAYVFCFLKVQKLHKWYMWFLKRSISVLNFFGNATSPLLRFSSCSSFSPLSQLYCICIAGVKLYWLYMGVFSGPDLLINAEK